MRKFNFTYRHIPYGILFQILLFQQTL